MKNKLLIGLAVLSVAVCVSAKANAVNFFDTHGTEYEGAVERLSELGIVSGVSKNTYNAERTVTRAEFAKLIVESALKPSEFKALITDDAEVYKFKDIDKKAWYYDYVVCAINGSFMNGYDDGTFRPNQTITYAEISKMVTKALGHDYLVPTDPRGWQAEYVDKMYEYNLFDGTVGITSMFDEATRGNTAIIVWNMLTTHTWKMIYRNDVSGFSYVDSGLTLMDQKLVKYAYLLDAKIDGFEEVNGNINVILNGRSYKIFDQSAEINFSMIGGTTDVLLKRVEYPGILVRYEVVGLTPDIGANLITGTYDQVKNEGYDLSNKTKLSKEADFYYVLDNKLNDEKDRVISVNINDMCLVDKIKINDQKEKEDKNADKSHSEVPKNFEDDVIAYRYKTSYEILERTITLNDDDDLVIHDGAVVFKNNKRIKWSDVKKGDILVEVTKDKYYFVTTTTSKTVRLEDYSTKKDEWKINTSAGEFKTYRATLYYDYLGNDPKVFNSLKDSVLKNLIGKNMKIYLDQSDRVVKIQQLEDEVKLEELHIGIFDSFTVLDKTEEYNEVTLNMDGKKKTYRTSLKASKVRKGDLAIIKFDKNNKSVVASIAKVTNSQKLTDNLDIKLFKYSDLKKKIKYYDEEKILITRINYEYDFGQYDKAKSYSIEQISLKEFNDYEDDANIDVFAITDMNDGVLQVFVQDHSSKGTIYYGLILKTYKDNGTQMVRITPVNGTKEDYSITGTCNVVKGDFVKYQPAGKNSIKLGEKYTTKVLGYYKDLIVEGKVLDNYKKTIGYALKDDGKIDLKEKTIKAGDQEYSLDDYDMFLIRLAKDEDTKEYSFSKVNLVTSSNLELEKGDRLAIDEIDGAIIIYRGYEE